MHRVYQASLVRLDNPRHLEEYLFEKSGNRQVRSSNIPELGEVVAMSRRDLSPGEAAVLKMIQEGYGPQNSFDAVFFTRLNEAAIFVKAPDGTSRVMANLTNLAAWRADGIITSDEELKKTWLQL